MQKWSSSIRMLALTSMRCRIAFVNEENLRDYFKTQGEIPKAFNFGSN